MRKSIKKIFTFRKGGRNNKDSSLESNSNNSPFVLQQPLTESAKIQSEFDATSTSRDIHFDTAPIVLEATFARTACTNSTKHQMPSEKVEMASDSPTDELLGSTIAPGIAEKPATLTFQAPQSSGYHDEHEAPHLIQSYNQIPVLEQTKLPRGGVSIDTKAAGRVQFGIPPETIKDSMRLGLPVPQVYIVPVERFCREIGPALGVNLAEFEFPAYFNFFVYKKRCTLVVDSSDAEDNIRRVFSETLLGPAQFSRAENPVEYEEEDFAPDFPRDAIPNFQKELQHFRIMPDGKELVIETLLNFCHFEMRSEGHDNLGVPPPMDKGEQISSTSEDLNGSGEICEEIVNEEDDDDIVEEIVPTDEKGVEIRETKNPWTYSQATFMGDVSTVWPANATEEQIKNRSVPRVEIFKMPGGTEYIIHDIDEQNYIVGKARLSGHVKVSESMSVDGFGGHSIMDDIAPSPDNGSKFDDESIRDSDLSHQVDEIFLSVAPPTFHPPSFGVTVLGNSHGFDKSGSVSGYVLWINGRGVMIDPPPYSSATLEREGIRPRTIVGIILTHCHADHDAGAFQKVLTGSPVVVITTPTIYKSFIRKYAALSALSPALLRHSHRFKPAIIGSPLRFQGATFHFTYTLHTIPCVGFRVEWRGRSMVFTGDHFNSPEGMDKLEASGVLSKARADDLRNLPLQDTDLLLHEAGAPPIHTPLEVLLQLPPEVKKRLYVVHTSALPPDCELKAAPTGTKGTIRLDDQATNQSSRFLTAKGERSHAASFSTADEANWNGGSEYGDTTRLLSPRRKQRPVVESGSFYGSDPFPHNNRKNRSSVFVSATGVANETPPLVALRPASSTDAWYILNLLSAVPFLSSLSYTSTMELLETARVDAYKKDDIIVPASRRSEVLCVVWEGTCAESRSCETESGVIFDVKSSVRETTAVWHAGDWTGPISLQPETVLSGESSSSKTHDVVAVSSEGVKVITVENSSLHYILKNGSTLYGKYLERKLHQERAKLDLSSSEQHSSTTEKLLDDALKDLNVLELLNCNSALRKLNAVQKRHLESLAEGPISFQPGERLWRAGGPVDRAFVIVSGSASFVAKRRNAGSATVSSVNTYDEEKHNDGNLGTKMQQDAKRAVNELGGRVLASSDCDTTVSSKDVESNKTTAMSLEKVFNNLGTSDSDNPDYERLKKGLEKRANHVNAEGSVTSAEGESHGDHGSYDTDNDSQLDFAFNEDADNGIRSQRSSIIRRRSSRARKANKVLGRLYNRRAFTEGLVFSRGHFLGDVSKMVAGLLASDVVTDLYEGPSYGFGDNVEGTEDPVFHLTIQEEEGAEQVTHSSTLTAGKEGCVVLVFPRSSIIPFLDQYPGLLLSLLGTQVVV